MTETVLGTLQWNEFEGGFWSIAPDTGNSDFVLQDWMPPADLVDGTRVRARLRVREAQIGFLMAGTYADVEDIAPA